MESPDGVFQLRTDRLLDYWADLKSRLPADPLDRVKLIAASLVLLVCLVWLAFFVATSVSIYRPAREKDTPGWRIAKQINEALLQDPDFADASVAVENERPLRFRVAGGVRTEEALAKLRLQIQQLRPENDYEFEVEVIGGSE